MAFNLPPEVNEALARLNQAAGPVLQTVTKSLGEGVARMRANIAQGAGTSTLGNTFRNLIVVGLNKSELLAAGEITPITHETWQDLVDDTMRRSLGLIFFAPRGLDGQPVNPYLFLMGEGTNTTADLEDDNAVALAQQALGGLALLDFCRMSPAAPNTVNILLAADTLFHWDVKDNYVLPTSTTGWVRDVEQILKTYPRTTRAHIYTAWETDLLSPTDRISIHTLADLPLDEHTWINQPTFQEKYGGHVLVSGLALAALMWAGLTYQGRQISQLNEQLHIIEQQIPREGRFTDLQKAIAEQEQFLTKRELFFLTTKDIARAIQTAGMKTANFEVKMPDPQSPPNQLVVTVEAEKNAYKGWLEEEPIAKAVLLNTATVSAVRKQPGNTYKLEGLVDMKPLMKEYAKLAAAGPLLTRSGMVPSSTTPATVSLTLPDSTTIPAPTNDGGDD